MLKNNLKRNLFIPLSASVLRQLDGSILPPDIIKYLAKNSYKIQGVESVQREKIYRKGVYTDELLIDFSDGYLVQIESTKNLYPSK